MNWKTRNSKYATVLVILLISVLLAGGLVKQEPAGSLNSQPLPKSASQVPDSSVYKLEGRALVETLMRGGYVIYFHLPTVDNSTPQRSHSELLTRCDQSIYQSGSSKDQARAMGAALKALKIPIGKVLSSELCSVAEKAKLAFEHVETTGDLASLTLATGPSEREQRTETLRKMLSTKPQSGTNTILVSHLSNLRAVTNESLPRGVGVVFEPLGEKQGFKMVTELKSDEWTTLAVETELVSQPRPLLPQPSGIEGIAYNPKPVMFLPDLQIMPPAELYIQYDENTSRKALRFSTTVTNVGQWPLEMWGVYDPNTGKTLATQYIQSRNEVLEKFVGYFIYHPTHFHWHYENFTVFELWSYDALDGTLEQLLATTGKMSFCITDNMITHRDMKNAPATAQFPTCNPKVQGISVGWSDIYFSTVPGQHLDITNVPDGYYAVRSMADPDNLLLETDKTNNAVTVYVQISGTDVIVMPSYRYG